MLTNKFEEVAVYNKPRRPYYDWSSDDLPRAAFHQTSEHQVIDSQRFSNLWKRLLERQGKAKERDQAQNS